MPVWMNPTVLLLENIYRSGSAGKTLPKCDHCRPRLHAAGTEGVTVQDLDDPRLPRVRCQHRYAAQNADSLHKCAEGYTRLAPIKKR